MKKSLLLLTSLACASTAFLSALPAHSADEILADARRTGKAFARVAKNATPAVVFIRVEKVFQRRLPRQEQYSYNDPFDFFRRFFDDRYTPQYRQYKQQGAGSGFLISKDGYILTNNHVVSDTDRITVRLKDGKEVEARLVGSDPKSEVAVIKIEGDNYPHLPLGDSAAIDIGEWVIAIGNPFGLSETVTVGVVSAKGRSNLDITDYEDFIQTDAAINPGNSGGPLLNIDGEVIGINTALFSRSGGYMGIGFAIPINLAKGIQEQLIRHGKVERGFLGVGIQPLTQDLAVSFGAEGEEGIVVRMVQDGSAADKAGLRSGDIILQLNGTVVNDTGRFRNEVSANPPGTEIRLRILRDGKKIDLTAKVGSLDEAENETSGATGSTSELLDKLGFSVEDITPEVAQRFNYEEGDGVIVSSVDAGSPADYKGLQPNDLIVSVQRKPVSSVRDVHAALRDAITQKRDLILLQVGRLRGPQGTRYVAIPVPEK